jgi:hypothetical protein
MNTASKLVEAGVVKARVSPFGWPDWMFENALALHDLEYANMGNGRSKGVPPK